MWKNFKHKKKSSCKLKQAKDTKKTGSKMGEGITKTETKNEKANESQVRRRIRPKMDWADCVIYSLYEYESKYTNLMCITSQLHMCVCCSFYIPNTNTTTITAAYA